MLFLVGKIVFMPRRFEDTYAITAPRKQFQFAHTDQNILKASVTAEWLEMFWVLFTNRRWNILTESVRTFPRSLKTKQTQYLKSEHNSVIPHSFPFLLHY